MKINEKKKERKDTLEWTAFPFVTHCNLNFKGEGPFPFV